MKSLNDYAGIKLGCLIDIPRIARFAELKINDQVIVLNLYAGFGRSIEKYCPYSA